MLEKLGKADWRVCDSCVGKIIDILDSENNVRTCLGGKKSVEGMRNSKDICFLEVLGYFRLSFLHSKQTLPINPRMFLLDVSSQDRVSDAPTV